MILTEITLNLSPKNKTKAQVANLQSVLSL